MSNFSGVTFPFQKVTPSDDAIVRRAVITDGILSGCKLTYAGTGLTMEAGNLLICGRQIRHEVAETWNFDGATSGYARLVLTIDTTRTSTLDSFDMVSTAVEYSTAENGFYSLLQDDINGPGTKYQTTICVVALSDGGINEIIQQLPAASAKGAGGLNFKVVGGLTRPVDPDENTVWVPTSLDIGGVLVSNAKPIEFDVGDIWIKTGYSSNGYLNISPDGTIIIYPAECYQFTDDAGNVSQKSAETYRAGKWRDWNAYLYNQGNEFAEVTGGWEISRRDSGFSVEKTASDVRISFSGSASGYTYASVNTREKIDLTNIATLNVNSDWVGQDLGNTSNMKSCISLMPSKPQNFDELRSFTMGELQSDIYDKRSSFDVRTITGAYYIYVYCFIMQGSSNVKGTTTLKYLQID